MRRAASGLGREAARQQLAATNPKFHAGKNPIEQEDALKIIEPTTAQQQKEVLRIIERMYGQANSNQKQALDFYKAQLSTEGATNEVKMQFLRRFYFWLLGRGEDRDHVKTMWGRGNVAVYNKEVAAYIEQFAEKRLEYALQLALLAQRVPTTLNGFYLYFKYVVNGELERKSRDGVEFWDLSKDNFLQDFELFAMEFDGGKDKHADIVRPAATRPADKRPFGGPLGNKTVGSTEPYPAGEEAADRLAQRADLTSMDKPPFVMRAAGELSKKYFGPDTDRAPSVPSDNPPPPVAPVARAEEPTFDADGDGNGTRSDYSERLSGIADLLREMQKKPVEQTARTEIPAASAANAALVAEIQQLRQEVTAERNKPVPMEEDEDDTAAQKLELQERERELREREEAVNSRQQALMQQHERFLNEQRQAAAATQSHLTLLHAETAKTAAEFATAVRGACAGLTSFVENHKKDRDGAAAVAAGGGAIAPKFTQALTEQKAQQEKLAEEIRRLADQNAFTLNALQTHAKDAIDEKFKNPAYVAELEKLKEDTKREAALRQKMETELKQMSSTHAAALVNVRAQLSAQQAAEREVYEAREAKMREDHAAALKAEKEKIAKESKQTADVVARLAELEVQSKIRDEFTRSLTEKSAREAVAAERANQERVYAEHAREEAQRAAAKAEMAAKAQETMRLFSQQTQWMKLKEEAVEQAKAEKQAQKEAKKAAKQADKAQRVVEKVEAEKDDDIGRVLKKQAVVLEQVIEELPPTAPPVEDLREDALIEEASQMAIETEQASKRQEVEQNLAEAYVEAEQEFKKQVEPEKAVSPPKSYKYRLKLREAAKTKADPTKDEAKAALKEIRKCETELRKKTEARTRRGKRDEALKKLRSNAAPTSLAKLASNLEQNRDSMYA